ncbi:hypothetical protein ABT337_31380 [Saccharopolyspora hirsuta]|uniref:DUF3558 domain-containing protein n=1 Tax=Saccharopolyspora hirsuta TaxID=1837 RepID=A0A5M7C566_SACHI|nr:hypothetical protein [Saccharopolyspora hirsuta]KAA5833475.1 hypothetical protein F1721_14415 [Saccharopolyspora hirsuta]
MHPQQPGSWGPPPGGQFPQQPIQQPYPQTQPGYPQAQPGYPQFQQQPPRKKRGKRIGLIVGISLGALVLLGGGGYLVTAYMKYSKPAGDPPTNAALPAECDLVSEQILQRLHVTNPDPTIIGEDPESGRSTCGWGPTEGRDGNNERTLRVDVRDVSKAADGTGAAEMFERFRDSGSGELQELSGLGDEAFLVARGPGGASEVNFRKGQKIVTVTYSGWDKNFLSSSTRISRAESGQAVKTVAKELVSKL